MVALDHFAAAHLFAVLPPGLAVALRFHRHVAGHGAVHRVGFDGGAFHRAHRVLHRLGGGGGAGRVHLRGGSGAGQRQGGGCGGEGEFMHGVSPGRAPMRRRDTG